MSAEIEEQIRTFIIEEVLGEDDGASLSPDQPLLSGLLDSFGLMSLLGFLEERFEVTITNDQVVSENFKSVEALAEFVKRKQQGEP
ncbi:MAG: acyl carrier protein [Actinomycetota bacterium]